MWTAGILAACCAALSLLPLSRAQVVPFDTNGLAGICHASQADIRVRISPMPRIFSPVQAHVCLPKSFQPLPVVHCTPRLF